MWYYSVDGRKGENELEKVVQWIQSGKLGSDTLVWTDGMSDWVRLADSELAQYLPAIPPKMSLPPSHTPKQVFCTNCGGSVSEQAVACMSCGVKPTGYKKFCRQCGVAINSEQVVCTKCGTSVTAPILPDAKRVMQSTVSAVSPFLVSMVSWLPILGFILGIFAAVGVGVWVVFAILGTGNPLKQAKQGDWCRYTISATNFNIHDQQGGTRGTRGIGEFLGTRYTEGMVRDSIDGKLLVELLSNDGSTIKLRLSDPNTRQVITMDLSQSQDDTAVQMLKQSLAKSIGWIKIIEGSIRIQNNAKYTRETVVFAGQKFDCSIRTSTVTMDGMDGETITMATRAWTSSTAPAVCMGVVKSETMCTINTKQQTLDFEITQELASFGGASSLRWQR